MDVFSLVGWLHKFAGRLAVSLGLLTVAAAPASAFTMTFDELGNCSSDVGTCSSFVGPDPSGLVTNQNVLIFRLPSLTFSGQVDILDPSSITISDRLRWVPSATGNFLQCLSSACADEMIFYSLDSTGAPADVGLRNFVAAVESTSENPDGSFRWDVPPPGVNHYIGVPNVPLPAALPLFATGLGALGLLGWRRKRKNTTAIKA